MTNDPILEVLTNGTRTAQRAGQITPNDAEALRKEMQEAAVLAVEWTPEHRFALAMVCDRMIEVLPEIGNEHLHEAMLERAVSEQIV